jgi:transaldolase/glucose-6-phosphate isomerase
MASPVEELREQGQSVWFDYIQRSLITSGELARMVQDGLITGVTSNPTIFQKAISGSSDYDEALREIAQRGERDPYEAFLAIAKEDIGGAADALRPVYDGTEGRDGYVSLEAPPGIEHDTEKTVAEAKRMFELVGRPNVMIKVPGTEAGIEALEQLIADGVNVNVTLLFSTEVYERVANGYIAGLERRLERGQSLSEVASVASFFVSRVDTKVDAQLPDDSPLRGKLAVANAQVAYGRFKKISSGPRWEKLASAGARVQRPLWASTGTKDPAYSDVLYVEELVARDTVNTMPEATLKAFLEHGRVRPAVEEGLAAAGETLKQAAAAGIDLRAVTDQLLEEGLAAFAKDFERLLEEIGKTWG